MDKNEIHPSAHISSDVKLGSGNVIGANVSIIGEVSLGNGNHIGPGSVIQNRVVIGDENQIYGPISIGSLGEMGTKGDSMPDHGVVKIGNRNTIREFTTINFPVRELETAIGDDCYLMARTHVPHDAVLGDRVVMATNSLIGGGCKVGDAAYIVGKTGFVVPPNNSIKLAKSAIKNKASYLAFGSFFSTKTKKTKHKATVKILNKAKKLTKTPLVAIGGINYNNYKKLLLNNANFLAISGYVWNNKKYKPIKAIEKLK